MTDRKHWPPAVSDGLTIPCADCGEIPKFDYRVADEFWNEWVEPPGKTGVVCLPCLDNRCKGVGLADALQEVQFTGTGVTVILKPESAWIYDRLLQTNGKQ